MIEFFKRLFESSKITRNTTPKIVSILFSIVLYIFVMSEVNPEVTKPLNNLKVEILNQEELENSGLIFIDQHEFTVDVKVTGKKNDLNKISPDDIKVTADLNGAKKGENIITLKVSNPVNVEIKEMSPQQINIRLDKIVQSQKPVEIKYKGNPATGYEIASYEITPDEILIEGPETRVEAISKVVAEVDVDGIKENIRKSVPIKAIDSQGNDIIGVDIKTKNVNVYLSLLKLKNVDIKPVIVGKVKEGYKITTIEVNPANITLRAKENILEEINEVITKSISVDELDTTLSTDINLELPSQVETPYLQGLPKVNIIVEKIETKEFTFKANQISVNNLKDNLTTNIGELNQDIKVKVSDARSILENVKRSDLELIIDAEGLNEGISTPMLKLNKSGSYENIEIAPEEIEIEIYNKKKEETEAVDDVDKINN